MSLQCNSSQNKTKDACTALFQPQSCRTGSTEMLKVSMQLLAAKPMNLL